MRRVSVLLVVLVGFLFGLRHSRGDVGYGARAGGSIEPDVVLGGGHIYTAGIGRVPELKLEAALEVGFGVGDFDFFMARGLVRGKYFVDLADTRIRPFPLLGLEYTHARDSSSSQSGGGLDLGGGLEYDRYGFEVFFGVGDVPDLNLIAYVQF